ncbi:Tetratricopeptide (TPR) repeat [Bosea lupini]|uniref:Tetratricopeptide (TPR) repeat n=1 Tax=Bosea lupini TaxID=1036779 RepID=A0A1H7VAI4_9HYPH|nr:toll/interleukin-1 receptor domain-containing protein [Bosea lupini]SEM05948.1 Tetratricopeptide (TPR) repeat [Bosea lupini]
MAKLPRAFLSHSSTDKGIVGEVAKILGRAAVIYDAFEFDVGDEFRDAILSGLANSDLFVLFASRHALQRDWVKFEIAAAQEAVTRQALSRVVTFIIDPDLDLKDIPEWMRSTLIVRQSHAGLIALDIRRLISQRLKERLPSYFVGRRAEMDQALDLISSFTDPSHRPPLLIYGLKGIGRRSLVQAIARDNLSYATTIPLPLKAGDLLPETYVRLSAAMSPGGTPDYAELLAKQEAKAPADLLLDVIQLMKIACTAGTLPVIIDDGALAQQNGILRPEFETFYHAMASEPEVDAMIVAGRRIYGSGGANLPSLRVPELDQSSTQNLLRVAGRDLGLVFNRPDLAALATYSRGYPPAVQFALDEARIRGVSQVVSNQRALVNFSAELFLRQLRETKSIDSIMETILSLLSAFSPLPLSVITEYCKITKEEANESIDHLLDLAFVIPDGLHFRISEPLRDAAYRAFDGLKIDSRRVADSLDAYLRDEPDDDARLNLGQTIFRASLLSGTGSSSRFAVGFAADLIQVATQSYHDQDYDLAIQYGASALAARPDNVDVRRYVAQALIRRERYPEADEHIDALVASGQLKEAFYIRGFAARRRRNYPEAIEAYEKSLAFGRGGVAIHRELASSYFELGNLPKAEHHIQQAEERSPHNRYVVDLRCTIALRLGDLETAERALDVLERVDPSGFADHRRSTYEQARGNSSDALIFANFANRKIARPTFEVIANLANCQIEAGESAAALSTLTDIQHQFGGTNHDAQTGLRCKYELRFGTVQAAEGLWTALRDPGTPVHKGLRLSILNRKAIDPGLSNEEESERQNLIAMQSVVELARIERLLGSVLSRSE